MWQTAVIFNERHENSNVHRKYFLELVAKFRETGTRKLETVCGVSRRTVQRILKAHSFYPSPDLSPLDFFMWGHLKSKIYATQTTSLEDLRQKILLPVFGNEAPHQSTISRWYAEFKRKRRAVRKLIIEDRHETYREIEASLKTSIQKNLHEELRVRKLVSRWIPHLLTEEQKAARVNCIVSGDESWIYCEEKPTKVIRSRSVSKKMVATFVSKAGHIATIPLNEQRTITADWYTTICLPRVITELRKIILHQDNASSHTAQKTRQYLTEENVELLDHPPYSPDLSPNDFFTFPKIKNRLRGQRFQSPEEANPF
ncbi:unnamed protein product [Acanthoscelides obtectus]|uniref:Tc1-like transposase DDE domain-containing protein n=1 Tax=Acanthoscelides obtectus TaxID=200917 RepID=A0A9P0P601_ACAOB|nr:unnamed protein product [Acanthoscelides obtectus]CAK1635205.1 Histone-lysine N-methyltransferase SETMAR [Acanthoscelides obtectus]